MSQVEKMTRDAARAAQTPRPVYAAILNGQIMSTAGSIQGAVRTALDTESITLEQVLSGDVTVWRREGRVILEITKS